MEVLRPCNKYGLYAVGPGWEQILTDLDRKFAEILGDNHTRLRIVQIKEKFGGLRVYYDPLAFSKDELNKIYAAIDEAETRSFKTCEVCGEPGSNCGGGGYWVKNFCPTHHKEWKDTGKSPLNKIWEERNKDEQVMRPRG